MKRDMNKVRGCWVQKDEGGRPGSGENRIHGSDQKRHREGEAEQRLPGNRPHLSLKAPRSSLSCPSPNTHLVAHTAIGEWRAVQSKCGFVKTESQDTRCILTT